MKSLNEDADYYEVIRRFERIIRILEKTKSFVYGIKVFEAHRELNSCIAGVQKDDMVDHAEYLAFIVRKMQKIDSFVVSMKVFEAHREISSLLADLNQTKDKLLKKAVENKGGKDENEE